MGASSPRRKRSLAIPCSSHLSLVCGLWRWYGARYAWCRPRSFHERPHRDQKRQCRNFLTKCFHVTHYGGCATLFNKDSFFRHLKSRPSISTTPGLAMRTGQDKRRRIRMGVTRCHFKSIFTAATAQRPRILHGNVSSHQQQLRVDSERSSSSPSVPLCWKSTWNWSRVTLTELPGANHMVTAPNPPVFSEKLLPTQIFQYLLALHHCEAKRQCQVNGPMYVALSTLRTRTTNGRFVCMELSQFPARPSAFVQRSKLPS